MINYPLSDPHHCPCSDLQVQRCSTPSSTTLPPHLFRGGTSCGFLVDTIAVKQALSCLLLRHEEAAVGDKLPVKVIRNLTPCGTFWVRKEDNKEQEAMLKNISDGIV